MDIKFLKLSSIFILFISSFIFCNVPILIACLIKRYFIQYKIKLSSRQFNKLIVRASTITPKSCCSNKLNSGSLPQADNEIVSDNESNNEHKIEISIKNYFIKYNLVSTYITCFSSGIFLATSMLELLPNVVNNINELKGTFDVRKKPDMSSVFMMSHEMPDFKNETLNSFFKSRLVKFPLAEFFVVIGLFLVMSLEQFIIFFNEKRKKKTQKTDFNVHENLNNIDSTEQWQCESDSLNVEETEGLIDASKKVARKTSDNDPVVKTQLIVLLVALSIHSVFEGLTIGLQTQHATLVNVLIAIIIHKCLIAFSFGQQIIDNFNRASSSNETQGLNYKYLFSCNFIFSLSNPIGILIAILMVDFYSNTFSTFLISLVKAISVGTFIYITFFEILPHELNSFIGSRILKVFFIFTGFILFSFIIFLN